MFEKTKQKTRTGVERVMVDQGSASAVSSVSRLTEKQKAEAAVRITQMQGKARETREKLSGQRNKRTDVM